MTEQFLQIRTNDDIRQFLAAAGYEPRILDRTLNGLDILGVQAGGSRKPAVFIKAGSHADELAGIYSALEVLRQLRTEHAVYIIPCANPFGFEGYNRCLSYALGETVRLSSAAEAMHLLRSHSQPLYENDAYCLFVIRGIGIVAIDEGKTGSSYVERWALNELFKKHVDLVPLVAGKYVFFPPEVLYDDGIEVFDHGIKVAYVNWEGWVGNPNRFYDRVDAPVEVACVRNWLNVCNPGMVIDMHESGGKSGYPTTGYYFVLPPQWPLHDSPLELEIARRMVEAARSFGCPLSSEVLRRNWINPGSDNLGDEFPADGILRSDQRPVMPFYQWGEHFEVSIVIETGMAQPLADRIRIQVAALQAALEAFAEAKR